MCVSVCLCVGAVCLRERVRVYCVFPEDLGEQWCVTERGGEIWSSEGKRMSDGGSCGRKERTKRERRRKCREEQGERGGKKVKTGGIHKGEEKERAADEGWQTVL